jgi:hypothetical protein
MKNDSPWWREKMMWLVVGLPLSVVVMCMVTAVMIWMHPNHLLMTEEAKPANYRTTAQMPAMAVRNQGAAALNQP